MANPTNTSSEFKKNKVQSNEISALQPLTHDTLKVRQDLARKISPKRISYPFEKQEDNKILNRISPFYAAFDSAGLLYDRKKEMNRRNLIGVDNYFHRLAMCELGQKTNQNPFYPVSALAGSITKELIDFGEKTFRKKEPVLNTIKDMGKDMKNNFEGFVHGLNNPDSDCEDWLKDLNMKDNTWKK